MRTSSSERVWSGLAVAVALGIRTFAQTAEAAPIAMPAGSTVWMHFEASACPDADGDDCIGSNLPGIAPPNGIPLTTITNSSSQFATGYAEVLPDRVRTFVSGNFTSFLRASFQDTYTVHGAATGSFPITVTLSADGVARTVNIGGTFLPHRLTVANVGVEIGTFNASAVAMQEQFRVSPFSPATEAVWTHPTVAQSSPFEVPFGLAASHTLTAGVGDVFDLAYGINSAFGSGEIDMLGTAEIAFTLPDGVWITSSLGGSWGAVPEPSTFALTALGLGAFAVRGRHTGASKR
jgi:hypothetical protein